WMPKKYVLPYLYLEDRGDFIILTPLDILTKDEAAINNSEFYSNFLTVANSIKNADLRNSINTYFRSQLPKRPTQKDKAVAINKTAIRFPEIIDYYIKSKEDTKWDVAKMTHKQIQHLTSEFIEILSALGNVLLDESDFY